MFITCGSMSDISLTEVGDKLYQSPYYQFPRREFGHKNVERRSFQAVWFRKWPWLHYDHLWDLAFCNTCFHAIKSGAIKITATGTGKKWSFVTHEKCSAHKTAVEVIVTLSPTTRNVGEMISTVHTNEKVVTQDYCSMLTTI